MSPPRGAAGWVAGPAPGGWVGIKCAKRNHAGPIGEGVVAGADGRAAHSQGPVSLELQQRPGATVNESASQV